VALRVAVSAADLADVLIQIEAEGHTSLRAIAAELESRGMRTRRGGRWGVSNVKGLMVRTRRKV
jgi:hypothetical protein